MSALRRFFFFVLVLLLPAAGCGGDANAPRDVVEDSSSAEEVTNALTEMLHASAASWNAGDLDGFLDDYWMSDELTFSGGTGVTRGWGDVRQRYLDSYWAPGVARDSLRFQGLEVMPLGGSHAMVLGQYVLFRPGPEESVSGTGYFSLVLRKVDGSWKIIHDHTSATPRDEG